MRPHSTPAPPAARRIPTASSREALAALVVASSSVPPRRSAVAAPSSWKFSRSSDAARSCAGAFSSPGAASARSSLRKLAIALAWLCRASTMPCRLAAGSGIACSVSCQCAHAKLARIAQRIAGSTVKSTFHRSPTRRANGRFESPSGR
jgi:hypothetical protein